MSIGSLLFSFRGRIGRKKLWLFLVLYLLVSLIAVVASVFVIFATRAPMTQRQAVDTFNLVVLCWSCLTLIPVSSVYVKRLHDRRRPGALLLVALIPSITLASIWPLLSATGAVSPNSNAWFLLPFAPFLGWLAVLGLVPFFTGLTGMKMLVIIAAPLLAIANLWLLLEIGFLKGRTSEDELAPDPLAATTPPEVPRPT